MVRSHKTVAIVVAAGRGVRMGVDAKKQFLTLAGIPVLAHAILPFDRCPIIDAICIVTAEEDLAMCQKDIVDRFPWEKPMQVTKGGETRQESVYFGLRTTEGKYETVVIHDGVRPLVRLADVIKIVDTAFTYGAAILAIPTHDTVKTVGVDDTVVVTMNRSEIRLAQTPQAFRYNLIYDAHVDAERKDFVGTDDASLVEKQGHPVKVIDGSTTNIKITTPEDLVLAEALLQAHPTIKEGLPLNLAGNAFERKTHTSPAK